MTGGIGEKDALALHALIDGELGPAAAFELEARLQSEPALAAEYAKLQTLRDAMRRMPPARAPDALRVKIAALAAHPGAAAAAIERPVPKSAARWGAIAAVLAALGIGLGAGWLAAPMQRAPAIEAAIVAAHVRGLVAARPVDIASSDQHNVRPWFAGKIAQAAAVPDLANAGFPLEGGRIDVIGGQPVPTLVYRHGLHTVSVTRLPARGASIPESQTFEGYAMRSWRSGDDVYVAVSDTAPAELDALAAAFKAAAGEQR